MARGRRLRPEATYTKVVNGHELRGERWNGSWAWVCTSWPALATQYDGCADSGPLVEEFTRRALAGTQPSLFVQEVVE